MKKTILTTVIIIGTMALAVGQTLIKDIFPGSSGSMSNNAANRFVEFNGSRYFFAQSGRDANSKNEYALYKMTGTNVELVSNTDHIGMLGEYAIVGSSIYYTGNYPNDSKSHLFSFDGTITKRHYVDPADSLATVYGLTEFNNSLFFTSSEINSSNSLALFSYDGSAATKIATGFNTFIKYDGALYFKQTQAVKGNPSGYTKIDIWKFDGTNLNSVTNIGTPTRKVERVFASTSDYLLFVVSNSGIAELWKYDGTNTTNIGELASIYPSEPKTTGSDIIFMDYKNGGHRIYTTDGISIDSLTPASTLGFSVGQYSIYPKFAYSPTYEKVYFTQAVSGNRVKNVYSIDVNTKQIDTVYKGDKVYLPFVVADNGQVLFGSQEPDNSHLLWTIKDDKSYLLCDTVGKKWVRNFWNMTTIGDTAVFSTSIGGDDYTGDEPHKISLTPVIKTNSVGKTKHLQNVDIYPNPATDILNIASESKIMQVTITDLTGKVLTTNRSGGGTLNISDLPKGIYMLQIINAEGIGYAKFIKQ